MRAGELCRLRWRDVDLAARLIYVRSTPAAPTKTRRSRVVSIVAELLPMLTEARRGQNPDGFVLGSQITVRGLHKRVKRAGKRAGLEVNLLICRHTRASLWLAAGVPMAKIAKQLGHSVAVCERFYAGLRETFDPDLDRVASG